MQTNNLLCNFEYAVFPQASLALYMQVAGKQATGQLPLIRVRVNFQEGRLCLEGDWHFLMACNKQGLPHWLLSHMGRVRIDANIYPAGVIDLIDLNNDGFIYPVEGIIRDGSSLNACSGLIVLDKKETNAKIHADEWIIRFNLYDYEADNSEIKFALPVYISKDKESNSGHLRSSVI